MRDKDATVAGNCVAALNEASIPLPLVPVSSSRSSLALTLMTQPCSCLLRSHHRLLSVFHLGSSDPMTSVLSTTSSHFLALAYPNFPHPPSPTLNRNQIRIVFILSCVARGFSSSNIPLPSFLQILAGEGGIRTTRPMVLYLLNRLGEFSEWHVMRILELLQNYEAQSEDELYDIMVGWAGHAHETLEEGQQTPT